MRLVLLTLSLTLPANALDLDLDHDGSFSTADCNDRDPTVYPGHPEIIGNGKDENCDGVEICWLDADDDGYPSLDDHTVASADADCTDAGEGRDVEPRIDCDDEDDRTPATEGMEADYDCHWESYGGHDYVFCAEWVSWEEARDVCHTSCGDLITIEDSAEDAWQSAVSNDWSD